MDALYLGHSPFSRGATLQAASQFNGLESPNSDHCAVELYIHDKTQGPMASLTQPASLIYRDGVVRAMTPAALQPLFREISAGYRGGYLEPDLIPRQDQDPFLGRIESDQVRGLRICAMWSRSPDTGYRTLIVYSAAPSFQGRSTPKEGSFGARVSEVLVPPSYRGLGQLMLLRAHRARRSAFINATMVGGGYFQNPPSVIKASFTALHEVVRGHEAVVFVHAYDHDDRSLAKSSMPDGVTALDMNAQQFIAGDHPDVPPPPAQDEDDGGGDDHEDRVIDCGGDGGWGAAAAIAGGGESSTQRSAEELFGGLRSFNPKPEGDEGPTVVEGPGSVSRGGSGGGGLPNPSSSSSVSSASSTPSVESQSSGSQGRTRRRGQGAWHGPLPSDGTHGRGSPNGGLSNPPSQHSQRAVSPAPVVAGAPSSPHASPRPAAPHPTTSVAYAFSGAAGGQTASGGTTSGPSSALSSSTSSSTPSAQSGRVQLPSTLGHQGLSGSGAFGPRGRGRQSIPASSSSASATVGSAAPSSASSPSPLPPGPQGVAAAVVSVLPVNPSPADSSVGHGGGLTSRPPYSSPFGGEGYGAVSASAFTAPGYGELRVSSGGSGGGGGWTPHSPLSPGETLIEERRLTQDFQRGLPTGVIFDCPRLQMWLCRRSDGQVVGSEVRPNGRASGRLEVRVNERVRILYPVYDFRRIVDWMSTSLSPRRDREHYRDPVTVDSLQTAAGFFSGRRLDVTTLFSGPQPRAHAAALLSALLPLLAVRETIASGRFPEDVSTDAVPGTRELNTPEVRYDPTTKALVGTDATGQDVSVSLRNIDLLLGALAALPTLQSANPLSPWSSTAHARAGSRVVSSVPSSYPASFGAAMGAPAAPYPAPCSYPAPYYYQGPYRGPAAGGYPASGPVAPSSYYPAWTVPGAYPTPGPHSPPPPGYCSLGAAAATATPQPLGGAGSGGQGSSSAAGQYPPTPYDWNPHRSGSGPTHPHSGGNGSS